MARLIRNAAGGHAARISGSAHRIAGIQPAAGAGWRHRVSESRIAGRAADSAAGSLWIGSVRYGGNHRFSIWARVKIAVRVERVLALTDLRPGQPITAAQVELAARDETPPLGRWRRDSPNRSMR